MAGKHTPGPWRVIPREVQDDGSVYPAHIVGGPLNNTVCPLEAGCVAEIAAQQPGAHWDTTPTKEANARLIAAAPDLLEACETVAESLCELEVQARNASRADTLGGLDQATIQRMFARLADALAVEQDALRPAIARATQPLPPQSEDDNG